MLSSATSDEYFIDLRILLSVAIVAHGIFDAVYALSVAPETNLNELSKAMVYP
jgi:hypothetical protein